jgi:hypothetical protein
LKSAVEGWLRHGLIADEVVRVFHEHMDLHRRGYHSGSGDQLFHVLQADLRRVLEAKRPPVKREPERPRRPRRRVLHNASGFPDVFDESAVARETESPVGRPSLLPGYEAGGEPILEDDEADA